MDDLKLYGKNVKEIDSLVQTVSVFNSDIGMDDNEKMEAKTVRGDKIT